jgi:class 3 adenylate cyclase
MVRAVMVIGIVSGWVLLLTMSRIDPEVAASFWWPVVPPVSALQAVTLVLTFTRWDRYVRLAALITMTAWGGWIAAYATPAGIATVGSMTLATVLLMSAALVRLPPLPQALTAIPYFALHQWHLVRVLDDGPVELLHAMLFSILVSIAVTVSWLLERSERREYEALLAVQERQAALERERARSEELLHNILPPTVAARLKESPDVIADLHPDVTVVFADIVGFTPMSATMSPNDIVELLNLVFTRMDALASDHGVEKIKTIGDAWMAVAGLNEDTGDHVSVCADLALALRDEVTRLSATSGTALAVRMGLASGPVVAGVIGTRRFAYDLWGDTVNAASRMESHGIPGTVQVTADVAERLRATHECRERGIVDVKGIGPTRTWLLERRLSDKRPSTLGHQGVPA